MTQHCKPEAKTPEKQAEKHTADIKKRTKPRTVTEKVNPTETSSLFQ